MNVLKMRRGVINMIFGKHMNLKISSDIYKLKVFRKLTLTFSADIVSFFDTNCKFYRIPWGAD